MAIQEKNEGDNGITLAELGLTYIASSVPITTEKDNPSRTYITRKGTYVTRKGTCKGTCRGTFIFGVPYFNMVSLVAVLRGNSIQD